MQIPSNTEDTSVDFTIETLLENFNENVVLPDFQRGYTWSEETVRSFIKSFLNLKNQVLGSAFLYKKQTDFQVVDGQQRLTTICLALHALDLLDENSSFLGKFFKSLGGTDSGNTPFDYASRIQMKKNYDVIRTELQVLGKDRFRDAIKTAKICFFITADEQKTLDYYVACNTESVPLTAAQLLKAFHYDACRKENLDPELTLYKRYALEFWRLDPIGLGLNISDIAGDSDKKDDSYDLSNVPLSVLKVLVDNLKKANGKLKPEQKAIPAPWAISEAVAMSADQFIADDNYWYSWQDFHGLFNTLQSMLIGDDKNDFARPILDPQQRIPGALSRLQTSERSFLSAQKNLLLDVLWVKSGSHFYVTANDLLRDYAAFQGYAQSYFKNGGLEGSPGLQCEKKWLQTCIEVLKDFYKDLELIQKIKTKISWWPAQPLTLDLYETKLRKTAALLTIFCITVICHHRFPQEAPSRIKNVLYMSLFFIYLAHLIGKHDYNYIKAGGADIAGRIILNSASADIAEQSMTKIMLERNSWSQGILEQLKKSYKKEQLKKSYKNNDISDISSGLAAMLNFV
ncbi:DUF262 domain-containing protein [uncultured Parasutterella sp.]|uniref:DUF262 domain-containing protein n=1 Tax=uncultured Parasutterella sp. TaxID=1263098 RepID=UPI0034A187DB